MGQEMMKRKTILVLNMGMKSIRSMIKELKQHEAGFYEDCQWFQYCCQENAFNSIRDFLDENLTGHPFDRSRQLAAYGDVASNLDGICGQKIHDFAMKQG